jgi:hypothetical protein
MKPSIFIVYAKLEDFLIVVLPYLVSSWYTVI